MVWAHQTIGGRRLIDNRFFLIIAILLSLQLGVSDAFALAAGSSSYALQAGAFGDDASKGNVGVKVNISTHIEDLAASDYDHSFWVGNNLANGAFIQFGYALMKPGYYCLHRGTAREASPCLSQHIESGDARWFWQYWPNINVPEYYYGIGAAYSAGAEGTWHTYAMVLNASTGWNFVLDDRVVDELDVGVVSSRDAVYVAAEVVTASPSAARSFGPVEFSNVSYSDTNGWHQVRSLTAVSGCGLSSANCNVPYVAEVVGPNHIVIINKK